MEKLFLMVYVDDFKMAGPAAKVDEIWKNQRNISDRNKPNEQAIVLGYPEPLRSVSWVQTRTGHEEGGWQGCAMNKV